MPSSNLVQVWRVSSRSQVQRPHLWFTSMRCTHSRRICWFSLASVACPRPSILKRVDSAVSTIPTPCMRPSRPNAAVNLTLCTTPMESPRRGPEEVLVTKEKAHLVFQVRRMEWKMKWNGNWQKTRPKTQTRKRWALTANLSTVSTTTSLSARQKRSRTSLQRCTLR